MSVFARCYTNVAALTGFDVDVSAWIASVISGGGTVSALQAAQVQTLVSSLKASGVWTTLDRLWLFAAENTTQALIDLVARVSATNHGATFTAASGYAGNGTTTYVDTNFNVLTGGKFTQDSAHLSVWQNVAKSVGAIGNHGVVNTDAGTNGVYVDYSVPGGRANDNAGASSPAIVGGVGHMLINRTGAALGKAWYNGASGVNNATASQTRQNFSIWLGARNFNNGTINQPSNAGFMACSIGGGLTDAQAVALYTALGVYKTAIGA